MKLIIVTALLAAVNALKVDQVEHKTIFERCSNDTDCPSGKWCSSLSYCKDCCLVQASLRTMWPTSHTFISDMYRCHLSLV